MRLVNSEFCQFGLHDLNTSARPVPRIICSTIKNLCDPCFALFNKGLSEGWDFTMKIIHNWAEECGPVPRLPNSISNPLIQAKLCYYLNEIINTVRNSINIEFPTFLNSAADKNGFILTVEKDVNIAQILHDTTDKKVIRNVAFRLWAGCMEGAKTTREKFMSGAKEIELTPNDRSIANQAIRRESLNDVIYKAGVEAALFFELIENKHPKRHLEGIPVDSSIRRYLRENSKSESIVTKNDLIEQ